MIFQFNCDCKADRVELMMKLENAIAEVYIYGHERTDKGALVGLRVGTFASYSLQ